MGGVKIEGAEGVGCREGVSPFPLGEGSGEGLCPLPRKILHFLHQNHTSVVHSDTLFEVILLSVENEQQCTKWFILQCYRQPKIAHGSKMHSTMLAINFLCKQTTHPQMVGFAQIVRVNCLSSRLREVIILYNSNFTTVKKRLRCEWGV